MLILFHWWSVTLILEKPQKLILSWCSFFVPPVYLQGAGITSPTCFLSKHSKCLAAVFNKTLGSSFTFSSWAPEIVNIVSGWTCVRRVHSYSQAHRKKLNKLQELWAASVYSTNKMRLEWNKKFSFYTCSVWHCRRAVIGSSLLMRECDRNVLEQENESSNRLRGETVTLITEDSREEGRVRKIEIQGNNVSWGLSAV